MFGAPFIGEEFNTLWESNIYESDTESLARRMDALFSGKKDISEYRIYDKSGAMRWIRDYAVPIYDNIEKRVVRIVGAASDISEQKEAEDKMIRYAEELKSANNAKDKFFTIVSHDMKNPIMGFKNLTELIVDEYDDLSDDEMLEILNAMKQSSNGLFRMFEDLVQWSKSQIGRIKFNPKTYDIYDCVREALDYSMDGIREKRIRAEIHIAPNTLVKFDHDMIGLTLRNLISNAVKFSHQKGLVYIKCQTGVRYDNKLFTEIEVGDNGIGISAENIEKLFKIDEAYSSLGTANEKGSGLGLLLCKEFVTAHGGQIWVESELGKGSSFKFTIPDLSNSD
jgi:signal transduction histidine kinase